MQGRKETKVAQETLVSRVPLVCLVSKYDTTILQPLKHSSYLWQYFYFFYKKVYLVLLLSVG